VADSVEISAIRCVFDETWFDLSVLQNIYADNRAHAASCSAGSRTTLRRGTASEE
jgi:hypothetical protein